MLSRTSSTACVSGPYPWVLICRSLLTGKLVDVTVLLWAQHSTGVGLVHRPGGKKKKKKLSFRKVTISPEHLRSARNAMNSHSPSSKDLPGKELPSSQLAFA